MANHKFLFLTLCVALITGCGSGGSDSPPIDQQPIDQLPDKINVPITEVQVSPIDFMFVSGPENVIFNWNHQILIPSVTGLNIFELDTNGFIDKSNKLANVASFTGEINGDILAIHNSNHIAFYDYDGQSVSEIGKSENEQLRQIPLDSINSCFYWVAANNAVQEACYENASITYTEIITRDIFISNILPLPEERLIVVSRDSSKSLIQLYVKENGVYTLKSQVQEKSGWVSFDMEYRGNFVFVYAGSSDFPGSEGEQGLIRYDISNNVLKNKLQLSEIITDNAQYDIIGLTPDGIMLADDKKLKHIVGTGENVEKIVFANIGLGPHYLESRSYRAGICKCIFR